MRRRICFCACVSVSIEFLEDVCVCVCVCVSFVPLRIYFYFLFSYECVPLVFDIACLLLNLCVCMHLPPSLSLCACVLSFWY
jgi:hypothetical protein